MVNLIGSALSEAGKDHRLGSGDVLVLEMDMVKLGTHKRCVEEVMKKFGRVRKTLFYLPKLPLVERGTVELQSNLA